jgi:hypothetical protein
MKPLRAHDSMSDYLRYVKSIVDSLQANECSLSEEDIITQILHGLLEAYSDVVTVMFDANLCHLICLFQVMHNLDQIILIS